MRQIKYIVVAILVVMLLSSIASAITPIEDERPPEVPADAEVQIGEEIEEAKEIVTKKTNITIERIHDDEAKIGEEIEIKLKITNLDNEEIKIFVSETHRVGIEYIDPIEIKYLQYQALKIPYYSWDITLPAKGSKEIVYHIKPQNIGMITFSPAVVNDEYGNVFESNPTNIKITCNPNGKCEPGENYIFCPEDCTTGIADGICDGVKDGRIDPDCAEGVDPDYAAAPVSTPRQTPSFLPIALAVVVILAVVIILAVLFRRRKKG